MADAPLAARAGNGAETRTLVAVLAACWVGLLAWADAPDVVVLAFALAAVVVAGLAVGAWRDRLQGGRAWLQGAGGRLPHRVPLDLVFTTERPLPDPLEWRVTACIATHTRGQGTATVWQEDVAATASRGFSGQRVRATLELPGFHPTTASSNATATHEVTLTLHAGPRLAWRFAVETFLPEPTRLDDDA